MTTSSKVPGLYPVALDGRPYLASFEEGAFTEQTIPVQKAQQDTGDAVGEHSLSTEDLWPRSIESWHKGSGQSYYDSAEGDGFRFDNSLGVDPWTKGRLSLLNETERKLTSTATVVKLAVAGSYLYCADGQTLKFTQDILAAGASTWTTVTGTPAATITGLTSDGNRVWASFGSNGIYVTTRGAASATLFSNQPTTVMEFVKGRLMTSHLTSVANVTEAGPSTVGFIAAAEQAYSIAADPGVSATIPPEAVVGDVVVIALNWSSLANLLPLPEGWTLIDNTRAGTVEPVTNSVIVWKRWAATDGHAVTFLTDDAITSAVASTVLYRDVYGTNPINVQAVTASTASSTSVVSPSVTTTEINTRILSVLASTGTLTALPLTAPASMTNEVDIEAGTYVTSAIADVAQPSAGASGTKTWTLTNAKATSVATTIAIVTDRPDPLITHANTDFTWVGFAEGQGDIYLAGYSGDKSLVYKTQIRDDATALDAPSVAGSLPDGEIVRSIYGYLGLVHIGTDRGVRVATSDANGNLVIGSLIPTSAPVRCFEGQDRFVWYGLENFDVSTWASGTYDGLGRLDLREELLPNTPAYASDLMVTSSTSTTESVQSVVTFQSRRVLSIGSSDALSRGVYAETGIKVANGYLDSGLISYGLPDTKVATFVDIRHRPLVGSITAYLSGDEGTFTSVGSSATASSVKPSTDPFPAGSVRADLHELRIKLTRADASDATGPTLTRVRLRAEPAPFRGRLYRLRLVFRDPLDINGQDTRFDVTAERAAIRALFDTHTLIEFQEGGRTEEVFIKDFSFEGERMNEDGTVVEGSLNLLLKAPGSGAES